MSDGQSNYTVKQSGDNLTIELDSQPITTLDAESGIKLAHALLDAANDTPKVRGTRDSYGG